MTHTNRLLFTESSIDLRLICVAALILLYFLEMKRMHADFSNFCAASVVSMPEFYS